MRKVGKRILKILLWILLLPISYLVVALVLSLIPVNQHFEEAGNWFYLSSNGVHVDIIFKVDDVGDELKSGLIHESNTEFLAFGWGDSAFYLNTPNWSDLTLKRAAETLFMPTASLMHVTEYASKRDDWQIVMAPPKKLQDLLEDISDKFKSTARDKGIVPNESYGYSDRFYRANGSYHCFNTCNTWINTVLKKNNFRAALWTPFDFGILWHY